MQASKSGVGIVWRQGRPVIDPGWVEGLNVEQRRWVEQALGERGFRLNGNRLEELNNGDSGNQRA